MPKTIYSKMGIKKRTSKPGDLASAYQKKLKEYEASPKDKKMDKKMKIKEGSKKDKAMDKKMMKK